MTDLRGMGFASDYHLDEVSDESPPNYPNSPDGEVRPRWGHRQRRFFVRWAVLVLASVLAFHQSLASVISQINNGDPLGYLVLVPFWGFTVAVGTHLRRRNELDIHDRQVDWIVAGGLAGFIVMLDLLLSPGLRATQELFRVDIFALLFFLAFGCTLVFGCRATGRYWATWVFLFVCWPLPYRLIGATLGGTPVTYGLMNVGFTLVAIWIAHGKLSWRFLKTASAVLLVGVLGVLVLSRTRPLVAELVPAAIGLAVFAAIEYRYDPGFTRGKAIKDFSVAEPRNAVVAVMLLAVALGFFSDLAPPSLSLGSLTHVGVGWTKAPLALSGWRVTNGSSETWTPRYFGAGSVWRRYWFEPAAASLTAGRVVVDSLTLASAGPLSVYPSVTCYKLSAPYIQAPETIGLGSGVEASLFYANVLDAQNPIDAQWVFLTWTWRIPNTGHGSFQRLTVITVEGIPTRLGIPTPESPATNGNVRTTFSQILRGTPTAANLTPSTSTIGTLEGFARSIVEKQALESNGQTS